MTKLKTLLLAFAAVLIPDAIWMYFSSKSVGRSDRPEKDDQHTAEH